MRNRLKVRGKLRSYLQLPLLLGILLAVMNVLIFMINTEAGIALCIFTVIYLGVVIFTMLLSGPAISSELISFATEYGQIQKQLLKDLEMPHALLDEGEKVTVKNFANEKVFENLKKSKKVVTEAEFLELQKERLNPDSDSKKRDDKSGKTGKQSGKTGKQSDDEGSDDSGDAGTDGQNAGAGA